MKNQRAPQIAGVSGNGTNPITVSAKGKQGPLDLEAKIGIPLTRLERVWAYLTVKQLLDQSVATNIQSNKTEYEKMALEIALKYSLVTDVTSLVVVKPNDTNSAINAVDASQGIFPESPNELPMCNNITSECSFPQHTILFFNFIFCLTLIENRFYYI